MVLRQSLGIHVRCLYTIQHWGYVLHMYGMLRREWDAQVLSGKRGSVRLIAVVNKSNSKSTTTFLNVDRSDPQGLRRSAVGSLRTQAALRRHAPSGTAKRGS